MSEKQTTVSIEDFARARTKAKMSAPQWIKRLVMVPPFATVMAGIVLVAVLLPVLVVGALTVVNSNALLRSQTRGQTETNTEGVTSIVTERLFIAEKLGEAAVRNFAVGILNASGPADEYVHAFMTSLSTFGRMSALSLTSPQGRLNGVKFDARIGEYRHWKSYENGTTCQWPINVDLVPIGPPDWCEVVDNSEGSWYTGVAKQPGACVWVPLYVYEGEIYASFSCAAFSEDNVLIGVVVVDQILGSVERLLSTTSATKSSTELTFIIEAAWEVLIASSSSDINTTKTDPLTGEPTTVPVDEVQNPSIQSADAAVRAQFGSWAAAANSTIWTKDGHVVSVQPVIRSGISWVVATIDKPVVLKISGGTYGAAAGITVGLLAIALVLSWIFIRPINRLSSEMAAISHLDFESKMTKQHMSRLREIREMQKSFLRLKTGTRALTRYISPEVVLDVMQVGSGDLQLEMKMAPLTILFTDLKGFTTMSEKLPHDVLISLLNHWFREFGKAITNHGGTIDKFIGDNIMALYGAPKTIEDAEAHACATALEFHQAIQRVNGYAVLHGAKPLEYRVGLHSGQVLVGHLGYEEHVNYTVCGNTANVASRMEQLGKDYGVTPLVSGDVALKVQGKFLTALLDIVFLRGHTVMRTRVYHLICAETEATQRERTIVETFERIHELVQGGHKEEAIALIDATAALPEFNASYGTALGVLRRNVNSGATGPNSYKISRNFGGSVLSTLSIDRIEELTM